MLIARTICSLAIGLIWEERQAAFGKGSNPNELHQAEDFGRIQAYGMKRDLFDLMAIGAAL